MVIPPIADSGGRGLYSGAQQRLMTASDSGKLHSLRRDTERHDGPGETPRRRVEGRPAGRRHRVTHNAALETGPDMYKTFRDKEDGCIKVVLKP